MISRASGSLRFVWITISEVKSLFFAYSTIFLSSYVPLLT
uniref:Uncharacterized protein n=1 Tax=Arundo donax TaxID=35708 RepID=A0A0A9B1H8_ARUDO